MKGILIINKHLVPPSAVGITLWPFIIFKAEKYATEAKINHEYIHIRQCNEMLVIPFYVLYVLNFLINLILMNPKPYKSIVFEKEAFGNEEDPTYLDNRKFWQWTKYLKK